MSARPGYDRGGRGGPEGPGEPRVGGEDYQGEWSTWVDQLPAATQPPPGPAPAPEFAPYEDRFTGLIDRSRAPRPKRRWAIPLLGTLGVAALIFAAYLQFGTGGSGQPAGPAPSAQAAASAATPITECAAERVGNRIQGNGVGGFDSGPAVIFAFQHAYYVVRSGDQVRSTTTADAAVQTADAIQRGIDTIPAGTTHCVAISPGAFAGQYVVVVTEHRPGQPPVTYNPQIVTTTKDGNRTLISAISRG
ncbi:hypothetical protein OHA40_28640 [Nocardia sp. NBC_00508]|uniref:hypothetical protein n=1 Tax=Nocardia sp. NBC_00508 TaxID=2975992 RepID=UPI002E7FEECB|nr:hypothetical protein [Nocardia sp. NBC_00508]WUD65548.1 hypothetical protein OHA40_28640 [Nocardia sp. NBC_00508]